MIEMRWGPGSGPRKSPTNWGSAGPASTGFCVPVPVVAVREIRLFPRIPLGWLA